MGASASSELGDDLLLAGNRRSGPFADKMQRLTAALRGQMAEAERLDEAIEANLRELGFTPESKHENME